MKKISKLMYLFFLLIAFFSLSLGLKVNGNDGGNQTNYFEKEINLKNLDFSSLTAGDKYSTNQISDMYTNNTFTAVENEIDGVSIKYVADGEYDFELFSLDGTGNDNFRTPGKYHFSADFKSNNAENIIVWVVRNYDEISGGRDGLIAEYRRKLVYTDGVLTDCTNDDLNGWRTIWSPELIVRPGYENDTTAIKDGIINISFDYEIPEGAQWGTQWNPTIAFKANTKNGSSYIFDNIKVSKVGENKKYFTYDWNYDYEDAMNVQNIHDVQPVWANVGGVESETPLDGKYSYRIEHTTTPSTQVWGDVVGGFDSLGLDKSIIKHTGLNYIQMDIDVQGFEWANIWTRGDDYYAIKYTTGSGWSIEGKIIDFKAIDLGNCFRISYYVNFTSVLTEHSINVYNGSGTILIDNLVVAYEDNNPYVENGNYNLVNPEDAVLNCSLKDGTITSLEYKNGSSLDTSLYSFENYKLTIKKEVFVGDSSYNFVLKTTKGEKEFTISMIDNRTTIESISSSKISKIYDGTNAVDMSKVELSLTGVEVDDDVRLVADYAFASSDAGENIVINLTNVSLEGKDASKYKLAETYSLTGEIEPKQLQVNNLFFNKVKEYDGNDVCIISSFDTVGIIGSDDVKVNANANYNACNVLDANEINILFTLTGEKKTNYIVPDSQKITEEVKITPIQLQVSNLDLVKEKVYDGNNNCTINDYKVIGILENDNVSVKAEAIFNDSHVLTANQITVHYTLSGEKAANYVVPTDDILSENVKINAKVITVTADNKSCVLGENTSELTYSVSGLLNEDALTGSLACEALDEAGQYDILIGSLSCSGDYSINFVGAKLTITSPNTQPAKKGCGSSPAELIYSLMSFAILLGSIMVLRSKKMN